MRILALDLATKTGWALLDGSRIESGTQDFSKKRGESNGMLFLHFNRWLSGVIGQYCNFIPPLDLIVYEQAHHRGGAATEICVGLTTRVMEAAVRWGSEYTSVHTATLKKFATGNGRAGKEEMIFRAMGIKHSHGKAPSPAGAMLEVVDDNEADALCLLAYAIDNFAPNVVKPTAVHLTSAT